MFAGAVLSIACKPSAEELRREAAAAEERARDRAHAQMLKRRENERAAALDAAERAANEERSASLREREEKARKRLPKLPRIQEHVETCRETALRVADNIGKPCSLGVYDLTPETLCDRLGQNVLESLPRLTCAEVRAVFAR